MIEIEKIDEVYLQIVCNKDVAYEIKDYFSCFAPKFMFHPRFKARVWDGKISFFDIKTNYLPIGLLPNLLEFFEDNSYEYLVNFDIDDLINNIDKEFFDNFIQMLFPEKLKPRDYQYEAIYKAIYNKRGVIELPTGSGKSLVIYSIIRFLLNNDNNILLVVPNITLVEQMFSDFREYGWGDLDQYVDILYSGKKLTNKPILISTWQSIYQKGFDFFSKYDAILMDECHGLSLDSKSLKNIMIKCQNASYKLGFTGTLPDEESDVFTVYGYIGPILMELTSGELIEKGILSKILIADIIYKYPQEVINKNKNRSYPEEERLVESFPNRYKVFNFIFDQINDGENTLILCRHIEHLKNIEKYLIDNLDDKYKVFVIYGEIKAKEREELRKLMEVESNMILIGSYSTMSTGVNVKKIHNVIFASSYKSKIKVLQSIGRGLRTHESKDKLILFDIIDDLSWEKRTKKIETNYILDHFYERIKFYDKQGFEYHNLMITDRDLENY